MSNIDQLTLTSLLTGGLAFKVYNEETSEWQTLKMYVPELVEHAGAIATSTTPGHVTIVNDLNSQSEKAAPTARALATVFEAVSSHVNEEESHLTIGQSVLLDKIPDILERLSALENPTTEEPKE